MVDKIKTEQLLNMVKEDTVPALGCTEPVAVAYATSVAKKYLEGTVEKVRIYVSKNIYKNGKSVTIPNTKEWGLDLAAALGIIGGKSEEGLMVLKNINKNHIEEAHKILKEGKIKVEIKNPSPDIYVKAVLEDKVDIVEVVIINGHSNISSIKVNEKSIFKDKDAATNSNSVEFLKGLTFKEIREICEEIDIDDLIFIKDGITINKEAALRGIESSKGLGLGGALIKLKEKGKIPNDAPTKARIYTAAGADYRMGGGSCPIMTSAGSGNQGIGVILPISIVAEEHNISEERLLRAIFFGHVINKYVKIYTGKLSAMCGCAIGAGVGVSTAIAWMLDGNDEQISGAAQNILSNLTGMICDGAKATCALKLATSAEEAVLSAYLALENIIVEPKVGIVGSNIEETIKNLGNLSRNGFVKVDQVIIDIIN
ncbi:MAG TPA: L-serine ammonia-lyase, iron-sulfur-dependent, subunit alpha [Tissierellales bacterium]|nr:L-serine ammonia-lyase, iron-sulfur-dependent, subunit alpha [Tissierellales bacterium]